MSPRPTAVLRFNNHLVIQSRSRTLRANQRVLLSCTGRPPVGVRRREIAIRIMGHELAPGMDTHEVRVARRGRDLNAGGQPIPGDRGGGIKIRLRAVPDRLPGVGLDTLHHRRPTALDRSRRKEPVGGTADRRWRQAAERLRAHSAVGEACRHGPRRVPRHRRTGLARGLPRPSWHGCGAGVLGQLVGGLASLHVCCPSCPGSRTPPAG